MTRLIAVCAVGLTCLLAPTANGAVLTVDCMGSGDYVTLGAAVAAAAQWDTIRVSACTYVECISIPAGRYLTIEGEGADSTTLAWAGPGTVISLGSHSYLIVRDISVEAASENSSAIAMGYPYGEVAVRMTDVAVRGQVGFSSTLWATRCRMSGLGVGGATRSAEIQSCRIGHAYFGGQQFVGGYGVSSHSSVFDDVELGCCAYFHSVADSVGRIDVPGGLDCWSELTAEGSTIDTVVGIASPVIVLDDCVLREVASTYLWGADEWPPSITHCLVTGSILFRPAWAGDGPVSGGAPRNERSSCLRLVHNTVLGDLEYGAEVFASWPPSVVKSNIVLGHTQLYGGPYVTISHNDFVSGVTVTAPGDSLFANFSADPLFCGPGVADYTLQECSPCAGSGHDGGDVGAFGAGCDCSVAAERRSWGAIKALFGRQPSN
jgi:hypothetical protein